MSIPSFRGKHNQLKCQAWLLLAICRDTGYWLTSEQIASILGVNIRSLRTALTKWTAWKRVLRRKHTANDGYLYEYRLSKRGQQWLEKWRGYMPEEYIIRIRAYMRKQPINKH